MRQIAHTFPAHAESSGTPCPGAHQAWVPWGLLLTHEWWHEATEHALPALGVQRPLPDNHKYMEYGYPDAGGVGHPQFYTDMFAGQVTLDGSIRGISPAEWALGTNRTAYERGGGGGGGGGNQERLRFGKVKSDPRHGTAKLTVIVPGPGTVKLKETGKVKRDTERSKKAGKVVVSIRPKPGFKRKLRASEKPVAVTAKVTYTSKSGGSLKGRKHILLFYSR